VDMTFFLILLNVVMMIIANGEILSWTLLDFVLIFLFLVLVNLQLQMKVFVKLPKVEVVSGMMGICINANLTLFLLLFFIFII
jgi:hypothetical protein